jgi:hypothetical protein
MSAKGQVCVDIPCKAMAIKATQRTKVSGGRSAGFAPGIKISTRWSRVDALFS